ncbi:MULTISPECIES: biotin--[acetyl-CoA-carboxylase] ligase [unclassified Microbacterium]|uniref:biotin--[acetyl-CoA-carboxylase] ligase n=1 Tax=unclassified Microbacterium TaxID=2609290 RepID=UPI00386B341D
MSHSEHGYPLAAEISPRLHVVDSVDSTNAKLLRDVVGEPDGHPHLAVVVTRDQTAGRGRLDREWTTPPGTALAVSTLLRVGAVPTAARGWIPLVAGAAMTSAVAAQLSGKDVALKWPNDVLVGGLKISGILAEVSPADPQAVVVGAGVNTKMTASQLPVPTATSFAALGAEVDEDRLLADYLAALRDGVAALAVGGAGFDELRERVAAACATVGAEVSVSLPGGTTLLGRAARLDGDGRLIVVAGGAEHAVAAGDVVHVR